MLKIKLKSDFYTYKNVNLADFNSYHRKYSTDAEL